MASNKSKNTKPELMLRRLLHAIGYRFRLHGKSLPGTPDIVFPGRHKVIWQHGCFWHAHPGCRFATIPKTHAEYWAIKFARNQERDAENMTRLKEMEWSSLIVWECELKEIEAVRAKVIAFLGPTRMKM